MKKIQKITAYFTAIVVALTCSGLISVVSALAAPKITDVKIIQKPTKTEFVQGADWDYGYYNMPEGDGLGTFVSDSKYISFKHNGGYYSRYADRGMVDMRGLVVRVTYSDGSTENITYTETITGYHVSQNILASPKTDYKVGENVIEVYFSSNVNVYDSYTIKLVTSASPTAKGDVNGDGKVNSSDALLVLQHVVGIKTLTSAQFSTADMNSDSKLNSFDALMILQVSVK